MAEKSYTIEFDGYILKTDIDDLPIYEGVYCVYECTYNQQKNNVSLHKLIYIGKTKEKGGIKGRIKGHEKWTEWEKHVSKGNMLCFSFVEVPRTDNERVEAAYINRHKPKENTEYTKNFPFDKTNIITEGDRHKYLEEKFTVERH